MPLGLLAFNSVKSLKISLTDISVELLLWSNIQFKAKTIFSKIFIFKRIKLQNNVF